MEKINISTEKYKSSDGLLFNTPEACQKHERYATELNYIMKFLGKKNNDINFGNGEGYYQHSPSKVNIAKQKFTEIANDKHKCNHGFGFIGRILDDSNDTLFYRAWNRLICIDDQGREWGQPYYANNPQSGKMIQLN